MKCPNVCIGCPDVSEGQVRTGEVRIGQVRTGQVRIGQVRTSQFRTCQFRTGQVRTGQVGNFLGSKNFGCLCHHSEYNGSRTLSTRFP